MYDRIVVGTDGSKRALDAVGVAGELAELMGTPALHVVAVCRTYSRNEVAEIQAQLPEEFHDLVSPHREALDRFNEADVVLPMSVTGVRHEMSGDPADGILSVAESIGADLIVVGARGLGTVERFVRGSVSTKVAHHSPCDVLIVEHDS